MEEQDFVEDDRYELPNHKEPSREDGRELERDANVVVSVVAVVPLARRCAACERTGSRRC